MLIYCWDEISAQWQQVVVDLPPDATPEEIAFVLDAQTSGEDPENFESVWEVRSFARVGPILTIETRSSRNHLSILVVNFEENPVVTPLVNSFKSLGLAHDPEQGS